MIALLVDSLSGSPTRAGSGLGSTFYKLDAAVEAKRQGWRLDYLTKKGNQELVRTTGVYENIYTEVPQDLNKYSKVISLGVDTRQAHVQVSGFSDEDFQAYRSQPHSSFWRNFLAQRLGYEVPSQHLPSLGLTPPNSPDLPEFMENTDRKDKWIAVSASVVSPLKYFRDWEDVARQLTEKDSSINVVYVGSREMGLSESDRIRDLSGKTTLAELMQVIAASRVCIGADGLPSHIGMRLGIPSLILFSMISPGDVLPEDYLHSEAVVTLLKKGCPYQFCYSKIENYRTDACLLEPDIDHGEGEGKMVSCMRFSTEDIVQRCLGLLAQKDLADVDAKRG